MPFEPLRSQEVDFSQAILYLNEKKYELAQETIARSLAKGSSFKALQIQALILKEKGDLTEAKNKYTTLYKLAAKENVPDSFLPSIRFEMGIIELLQKNYQPAIVHFNFVVSKQFNVSAALYFRGIAHSKIDENDLAIDDFKSVLSGDSSLLYAPAALAISDIENRSGSQDEAIYYLAKADAFNKRVLKNTYLDDENDLQQYVQSISQVIAESVKGNNVSRYYKSVSILAGYDSNVLSVPSSGSAASYFSNRSSAEVYFQGMIGHATAPFSTRQDIWAYQFSINQLQNTSTQTGEFAVNNFNYVWNWAPLSANSQSLNLVADYVFQYQVDPDSGKGQFSAFARGSGLTYLRKKRISPSESNAIEFSTKYESYLQDPAFDQTEQKSGLYSHISITQSYDNKKKYWNPSYMLKGSYDKTVGNEFVNYGAQVSVIDKIIYSDRNQSDLSLSYSHLIFDKRALKTRVDDVFILQWAQNYKISNQWTGLGSASYTLNNSNIQDQYQFDRVTYYVGVNCSF